MGLEGPVRLESGLSEAGRAVHRDQTFSQNLEQLPAMRLN